MPTAPAVTAERPALGRQTEALTCYDKALALQPQNSGMHNARADLLFEIERFEDAARDYGGMHCHAAAWFVVELKEI